MTVWITGMAGFIGQAAARAAQARGHNVCGVGITAGALVPPEIKSLLLNGPLSEESLRELERRFGLPETVIHAAGSGSVAASIADPAMDFQANVATTQLVCDFLRRSAPDARFVLLSSAAVYGVASKGQIDENTQAQPYSPYGHNKLAAEIIVRGYGINFGMQSTIVRLFSVYGEGLRKQVLWDMCQRLTRSPDIELWGSGTEQRDFIHVDDAVDLLFRCMGTASPSTPVVNGGLGAATSMSRLATMMTGIWKEIAGRSVRITFNGQARPGDPASLVANTRRTEEIGFHSTIEFEEGLRRYVRWFLAQQRDI
jgi:UDP-glucose 4-epimerase